LLWKPGHVFERFTDRARRVLVLAQEESRLLGHPFIGTEHILLGILGSGQGPAVEALDRYDVTLDLARELVEEIDGPGNDERSSPPFTPRARKVLELSRREALGLGHDHIDVGHLLLGLGREGEGVGVQVLRSFGVDPIDLRETVIELAFGGGSHGDDTIRPRGALFRIEALRQWPVETNTIYFVIRAKDAEDEIWLARSENPDLYDFIIENGPPFDDSTATRDVEPPG